MTYLRRKVAPVLLAMIVTMSLLSSCVSAGREVKGDAGNDAGSVKKSVISFNTTVHDIGKIGDGQKLAYSFIFTNNGDGDLVINSVTSTCGCTVPKYSNQPVSPGEKGTLEVVFDSSGLSGFQSKNITVINNSTTPFVQLTVKAEVVRSQR